MTVSLPKRTVLNLNFPYSADYIGIRMERFAYDFPAPDQFAGPYIATWTGGSYFLKSNTLSFDTDNGNSTAYTGNGVDRWIGSNQRIEMSRAAGGTVTAPADFGWVVGPPPATNYYFCRKDDEARHLAGKLYRLTFLENIVDLYPGALRFMNGFGYSPHPLMRWEHRSLPTDADYGLGFNTPANTPIYGTTSGTNQYTLSGIGSTPASMQHGEMVQCTIGDTMVRAGVKTVTAITKAANGRATATAHGFNTGDVVIHNITAGMTQLLDVPCTITVVDVDHYDTNVNTSGFSIFTAGTVNQYVTLQVGSGNDRVAYPVVFDYGDIPAGQFGNNYIFAGDTKCFYFDKALKRSSTVDGCWIFLGNGSRKHNPGVPPAISIALMNELNEVATAQGKGPIHMWINMPIRGLLSMDADYDAAQNVALKFIDLCLNGGDGIAALPSNVKIMVEMCNELWNFGGGFTASYYCARRSFLRWGLTNDFSTFATLRSCAMAYDIRNAYPTETAAGRVVIVQGGWANGGNINAGQQNTTRVLGNATLLADSLFQSFGVAKPIQLHDIFVTANYFYDPFEATNLAALTSAWVAGNTAQKDQAIADFLVGVAGTSPSDPGGTLAYFRDGRLPSFASALAAEGKLCGNYEGGASWEPENAMYSADEQDFLLAAKSSQQWATLARTYYDAFEDYPSAVLPGHYIRTGINWGNCNPDSYANGVELANLDPMWDEMGFFNNGTAPEPEPEPEPDVVSREVFWPGTRVKKRQGPDAGLILELQRQWEELREAETVSEKLALLEAAKNTAQELAQEPEINKTVKNAIRRLLLSPMPPSVMDDHTAAELLAMIEDEEEELEAIIYAIA